jgi:hypothetical protein
MTTLRTIWWRIRSLFQRCAMKRGNDEELRFHIQRYAAEDIAAGLSGEAAA